MRRFTSACMLTALATCLVVAARAEENKDPQAVLDKAITAMGGQEKLSAVKAFTQKGKGKIYIMGNESEITNEATAQGARMLWVGMPVMPSSGFSDQMQVLNRIAESQAVVHPGVSYLDSWHVFVDGAGGYSAFLPDASGEQALAAE